MLLSAAGRLACATRDILAWSDPSGCRLCPESASFLEGVESSAAAAVVPHFDLFPTKCFKSAPAVRVAAMPAARPIPTSLARVSDIILWQCVLRPVHLDWRAQNKRRAEEEVEGFVVIFRSFSITFLVHLCLCRFHSAAVHVNCCTSTGTGRSTWKTSLHGAART